MRTTLLCSAALACKGQCNSWKLDMLLHATTVSLLHGCWLWYHHFTAPYKRNRTRPQYQHVGPGLASQDAVSGQYVDTLAVQTSPYLPAVQALHESTRCTSVYQAACAAAVTAAQHLQLDPGPEQ